MRTTPLLVAAPLAVALALLPVMLVASGAQQVGLWSPWTAAPALATGVALAAVLLPRLDLPRLPWPSALLLLALCAGLGTWAALTHGEHLVVRRDPGAYATYALALARYGGVPLDPGLDVFGLPASDPWVRVGAAANYAVPGTGADGSATLLVSPQFLVGVPALLSGAWLVGGWSGLLVAPAVVAALALAAFAGLAAQLLGARWALLATALLGVSQPVVLVARQTFSEPFSLLYLLTAATLLVLAAASRGQRARLPALVAGLLLGAHLLVRIDAVRELVLLVPLVALLAGRRHPAAGPLAVGTLLTGVPAALATRWWDSPYVASVASSLGPLVAAGAVVTVLSAAALLLGRRVARRWDTTGVPRAAVRAAALLPAVAAATVALVGVGLASRPLWLVDSREPYLPGMEQFVGALQQQQGLPVDGLRTYAEDSVVWLVWWLGPVTVLLALVASVVLAAVGTRAVLSRQPLPRWLLPVVVGLAVTVLSLYRPAITPDHPWADRRYVTVTYPYLVLAATATLAWLVGTGRRGTRPAAAVLAAAMLLPTALATLPLATARTETGQVAAVGAVCAALEDAGPRPAVLAVGFRARVEWAPVVRARCGVPFVGIEEPSAPAGTTLGQVLGDAAATARAGGYAPVVLVGDLTSAQTVADATGVTLPPVVSLRTTEPERLLEERPLETREMTVDAWLAPLP
ncbi:hypothetical protein [Aquipuribacter hungaricus]|uniref:Glycosyltransferase RgtA/B/C/D-like domain-containing protein n=1 Tax=Aquipuribacter hungaricus TaxID=545624 RepID=A0ABV7WGB7_9MICO